MRNANDRSRPATGRSAERRGRPSAASAKEKSARVSGRRGNVYRDATIAVVAARRHRKEQPEDSERRNEPRTSRETATDEATDITLKIRLPIVGYVIPFGKQMKYMAEYVTWTGKRER